MAAPSAAADSTPSEPAASADASSATTDVAAEQPAEEPAETMAAPAVETSTPTAAADDSPDVADTQAASAEVEPATAAADTAAADTGEPETPYNVLAKAREAYWLRDFAMAEQQYTKLTQLEPDNPDGYGELGNMYFSRGMWDEAANAYYEAGVRLLDEGLIVQARQMVDVIRGLNGSQADELDAQINAATTSSP
jgi:tetratricopeptide (TPR) repeat protein